MGFRFSQDLVQEARRERIPLVAVELRRPDEGTVSISGFLDDDAAPVVESFVKWLIRRDDAALEALRTCVADLKAERSNT